MQLTLNDYIRSINDQIAEYASKNTNRITITYEQDWCKYVFHIEEPSYFDWTIKLPNSIFKGFYNSDVDTEQASKRIAVIMMDDFNYMLFGLEGIKIKTHFNQESDIEGDTDKCVGEK